MARKLLGEIGNLSAGEQRAADVGISPNIIQQLLRARIIGQLPQPTQVNEADSRSRAMMFALVQNPGVSGRSSTGELIPAEQGFRSQFSGGDLARQRAAAIERALRARAEQEVIGLRNQAELREQEGR